MLFVVESIELANLLHPSGGFLYARRLVLVLSLEFGGHSRVRRPRVGLKHVDYGLTSCCQDELAIYKLAGADARLRQFPDRP